MELAGPVFGMAMHANWKGQLFVGCRTEDSKESRMLQYDLRKGSSQRLCKVSLGAAIDAGRRLTSSGWQGREEDERTAAWPRRLGSRLACQEETDGVQLETQKADQVIDRCT